MSTDDVPLPTMIQVNASMAIGRARAGYFLLSNPQCPASPYDAAVLISAREIISGRVDDAVRVQAHAAGVR